MTDRAVLDLSLEMSSPIHCLFHQPRNCSYMYARIVVFEKDASQET